MRGSSLMYGWTADTGLIFSLQDHFHTSPSSNTFGSHVIKDLLYNPYRFLLFQSFLHKYSVKKNGNTTPRLPFLKKSVKSFLEIVLPVYFNLFEFFYLRLIRMEQQNNDDRKYHKKSSYDPEPFHGRICFQHNSSNHRSNNI